MRYAGERDPFGRVLAQVWVDGGLPRSTTTAPDSGGTPPVSRMPLGGLRL
jgi:hypothetical protein